MRPSRLPAKMTHATRPAFGRRMQTAKTMPLLAEKPRHASLRVLYIGTAILILVLLAGTATVLLHLRETEVRDQENQLKNLSLILAEQAERSFESVDLVVLSVAERIAL